MQILPLLGAKWHRQRACSTVREAQQAHHTQACRWPAECFKGGRRDRPRALLPAPPPGTNLHQTLSGVVRPLSSFKEMAAGPTHQHQSASGQRSPRATLSATSKPNPQSMAQKASLVMGMAPGRRIEWKLQTIDRTMHTRMTTSV